MLSFWRDLLDQNVLELADLDAVCETIALTVGIGEDAIDLDAGLADLYDIGSPAGPTVARTLAGISASASRRRRAIRAATPRRALGPGPAGPATRSGDLAEQ